MALTPDQEKLKEAALAATPGPWKYSPMTETEDPEIGAANGSRVALLVSADVTKQNSAFIGLANPAAILAILAQLEQVQGDAERLDFLMANGFSVNGGTAVGYWVERYASEEDDFLPLTPSMPTRREAIDAAMALSPLPPPPEAA